MIIQFTYFDSQFVFSNSNVILFHITATKWVTNILKNGLDPKYTNKDESFIKNQGFSPEEIHPLVYTSKNPEYLNIMARNMKVVTKISNYTLLKITIPINIFNKMDTCKDPLIDWTSVKDYANKQIKESKDAAEFAKQHPREFMETCKMEYDMFDATVCFRNPIDPKYIEKDYDISV